MDNEDKLSEEIGRLLDRYSAMDPKSDDSARVLERIKVLQGVLNQESERKNNQIELKLDAKKLDADNEKLLIESEKNQIMREQEEGKRKQSRKDKIFQTALEILKGVVFVGANGALVLLTIMANNSGESLPPFASKVIGGLKWR